MGKFQVPVILTVEADDYETAHAAAQNGTFNTKGLLLVDVMHPSECERDNYDEDDEEEAEGGHRVLYLHNEKKSL